MTKKETFHHHIKCLQDFFQEQEKLDAVLNVISPSSTGVVEFGNEFIDNYIDLLESYLEDNCNWVSWFVFDNQFGEKGLEANGVKITSPEIFFDVVFDGKISH